MQERQGERCPLAKHDGERARRPRAPAAYRLFTIFLACGSAAIAAAPQPPGDAELAWLAVGKGGVGGARAGQAPGEVWASDDGPSAWFFASQGLLGCMHTPSNWSSALLVLRFQMAHVVYDSRAQPPVADVPDVILRCQPARNRTDTCGRGRGDQKVTAALYGVINPWEASSYRVPLASSRWVNMESKRSASIADVDNLIHCAGQATLMIRAGHFMGAETVQIKDVRLAERPIAGIPGRDSSDVEAVTRVPLATPVASTTAVPDVEPSPLLHGRDHLRHDSAQAFGAGGPAWSSRNAEATGREECFGVRGLDVFATGARGVLAVAGETLLLATPGGVRRFPLLSQPVFPSAGDEGPSGYEADKGNGGLPRRDRLWTLVDGMLIVVDEKNRDSTEHVESEDFPEEEWRAVEAVLASKFPLQSETASHLPVKLPDELRHARASRALGDGPGAGKGRKPVDRVGSYDAGGHLVCMREREGSLVWGENSIYAPVFEPIQSWAALSEYLEDGGGWSEVVGAGRHTNRGVGRSGSGVGSGARSVQREGAQGFGAESIAMWKARRKQQQQRSSDASAASLQQHLKALLATDETGGVGELEVVAELASPTCALAVVLDSKSSIGAGTRARQVTGRFAVLSEKLTVLPLSALRSVRIEETGSVRVIGRVEQAAKGVDEEERGAGTERGGNVLVEFSSAGLDAEELRRFFARVHHQQHGKLEEGGDGFGGGNARQGRRLLVDDPDNAGSAGSTGSTAATVGTETKTGAWPEREAALAAATAAAVRERERRTSEDTLVGLGIGPLPREQVGKCISPYVYVCMGGGVGMCVCVCVCVCVVVAGSLAVLASVHRVILESVHWDMQTHVTVEMDCSWTCVALGSSDTDTFEPRLQVGLLVAQSLHGDLGVSPERRSRSGDDKLAKKGQGTRARKEGVESDVVAVADTSAQPALDVEVEGAENLQEVHNSSGAGALHKPAPIVVGQRREQAQEEMPPFLRRVGSGRGGAESEDEGVKTDRVVLWRRTARALLLMAPLTEDEQARAAAAGEDETGNVMRRVSTTYVPILVSYTCASLVCMLAFVLVVPNGCTSA